MARSKALAKSHVVSQEYVRDSSSSDSDSQIPRGSKSTSEKALKDSSVTKATKRSVAKASKDSVQSSASADTDSASESSEEETSSAASSNSESGEESESSSPKQNGTKRRSPVSSTAPPSSKRSKSTSHQSSNPLRTYHPPSGYTSVDQSRFAPQLTSMFSELSQKQVWHITAPVSVPIASIKKLDIQAALRGDPILQHDGASYKMFSSSTKSQTLLLPSRDGTQYRNADVSLSRDFHLTEMTRVAPQKSKDVQSSSQPGVTEADDKLVFCATEEGSEKQPRPQSTGLMMRYKPYGTTSNGPEMLPNPDHEEVNGVNNTPAATFLVPSDVDESVDTEDAEPQVTQETLRKNKKDKGSRKTKHQDSSQRSTDSMDIDAMPERKKKKKKDRH